MDQKLVLNKLYKPDALMLYIGQTATKLNDIPKVQKGEKNQLPCGGSAILLWVVGGAGHLSDGGGRREEVSAGGYWWRERDY
jgi:hypothetical protein